MHQAAISTDLQARLSAVAVREGDVFKEGDVLIEFDCRKQRATVDAADATVREMQLNLDKFQILSRMQSVGKNDLEVADARLARATAEANALRAQLHGCVIAAPFAGRVMELSINRHEIPQPGRPFLMIASTHELEVDVLVPSIAAAWIKPGHRFRFAVDELSRVFDMRVVRVGAGVDPVSQTLKVIARIEGDASGVLPGMSGSADLAAQELAP